MDAPPSLTHSPEPWRPIHYLGSKLRVVDAIGQLADQVDPRGSRICDLFAGSGTVSSAIGRQRAVTAVDVQDYSRVLCSALLKPATLSQLESNDLYNRALNSAFYEEIKWAAQALIQYETRSMEEARQGRADSIFDLIESSPIVGSTQFRRNKSPLHDAFRKSRERLCELGYASGPKTVVLRHFGGVYFSYCQAAELTALLDVATQCTGRARSTVMAAILSSASEVVNTVGKQFAQPIRPRDRGGKPKRHLLQKVITDRSLSVFPIFSRWLDRYRSVPETHKAHRIVRADYRDALDLHCEGVGIIYADPPYTRDHYSRFYHVLETMCLGDDPQISATHPSKNGTIGRGIYRTDRHQSPFCIKSQAPNAFLSLFRSVQNVGVPLILSYSPLAATSKPRPRVIEIQTLIELASPFFKRVEILPAGRIRHSKLNKAELNSEVSDDGELFLVCT
jgi:adenine-specific DNA methylase